jgi:hypothetical protein
MNYAQASINSDVFFEEELGIKELATAYKSLDEEKKIAQEELKTITLKIQLLIKELGNLQDKPTIFQSKFDELENLQRDYKFKQDGFYALPRKFKVKLMNKFKIREALIKFRKEKGFDIILDEATLNDFSIITDENVYFPSVTSEFVRFYNRNYASQQ